MHFLRAGNPKGEAWRMGRLAPARAARTRDSPTSAPRRAARWSGTSPTSTSDRGAGPTAQMLGTAFASEGFRANVYCWRLECSREWSRTLARTVREEALKLPTLNETRGGRNAMNNLKPMTASRLALLLVAGALAVGLIWPLAGVAQDKPAEPAAHKHADADKALADQVR